MIEHGMVHAVRTVTLGSALAADATAATNLVSNPGFEVDVTGWQAYGFGYGGGSIARSTVRAKEGVASGLITWPTFATGSLIGIDVTFVVGQTYTASAWVYVPAGSADVRLTQGYTTSGVFTAVKDQWVQITHSFVATATTQAVGIEAKDTTAGQQCWVDALTVTTPTVLTVDDAIDFSEVGGTLRIGASTYVYSTRNLDTNEITLASPFTATAVTGTPVEVWPLTVEKYAVVVVADNDEAVNVRIPHVLMDRMADGIRDDSDRELVTFEVRNGTLVLLDVVGREPVIDGNNIDPTTLPANPTDGVPPSAAPTLTAEPTIGAVLLRWTSVPNGSPVKYRLHVSEYPDFVSSDEGTFFVPNIYDDFSTDSLPVKWPGSYNGAIIADGQAQMESAPGMFAGIDTDPHKFDLTNSDITGRIVASAAPGATQEYGMSANYDTNNRFVMYRPGNNTQIVCRTRVAGVNTDVTAAANDTMIYWRIRNTPGQVFYYASPDRVTWTQLAATVHSLTTQVAAMSVDISVGDNNAGSVLPALTIWADDVSHGVVQAPETLLTPEGTQGNFFTAQTLPDGRELEMDRDYYFKVGVLDDDGMGPFSTIVVSGPMQATSGHIAPAAVTTDKLAANVVSTDSLASRIALVGDLYVGDENGAHIHQGGGVGQRLFAADGSVLIDFPIDGSSLPRINSEAVLQGARVEGNFTLAGGDTNEIATDTSLTMTTGITPPLTAPTVQIYNDYVTPQLVSRSGPLGTFALVPSEVHYMVKNPGGWVEIFQNRANGTRKWYYNLDGTPFDPYFGDWVGWEVVGEVYPDNTMGRSVGLLRQHSNNQWIINVLDHGIWNTYHPAYETNPAAQKPTIGCVRTGPNAGKVFVAEVVPATFGALYGRLSIKHLTFNTTTNFADVGTTQTLGPTDLISDIRMAGVLQGAFDLGVDRYVVGTLGTGYNFWTITDSLTTRTLDHDWEAATGDRRGFCWDEANGNFLSFHGDGRLYSHTGMRWAAADSSRWWIGQTWNDSDAGGTGLHETHLGAKRAVTARRRGKWRVDFPAVPDFGGSDDPDQWRLYIGRGAAEPANTAMYLQTGGNAASLSSATLPAFSGTNPPLTNNFPGATPASVKSSARRTDTLPKFEAKGDGSGRWGAVLIGTDQKAQIETGFRLFAQAHEGWTVQAYSNSWTTQAGGHPSLRYRLDPDGYVTLRGVFTKAGGLAGSIVATLPAGVRPLELTYQIGLGRFVKGAVGEYGLRVEITTGGAISVPYAIDSAQGHWVSVNGVRFPTF